MSPGFIAGGGRPVGQVLRPGGLPGTQCARGGRARGGRAGGGRAGGGRAGGGRPGGGRAGGGRPGGGRAGGGRAGAPARDSMAPLSPSGVLNGAIESGEARWCWGFGGWWGSRGPKW